MQLGIEAHERSFGEAVVEVGHQPDGVGQVGTGVEGRATLVVDEHEVEVLRSHRCGQAQHERAQQFALARPGRPGDQTVRSVAHQVDVDPAVDRGAERCRRRGVGSAAAAIGSRSHPPRCREAARRTTPTSATPPLAPPSSSGSTRHARRRATAVGRLDRDPRVGDRHGVVGVEARRRSTTRSRSSRR